VGKSGTFFSTEPLMVVTAAAK